MGEIRNEKRREASACGLRCAVRVLKGADEIRGTVSGVVVPSTTWSLVIHRNGEERNRALSAKGMF